MKLTLEHLWMLVGAIIIFISFPPRGGIDLLNLLIGVLIIYSSIRNFGGWRNALRTFGIRV